MKTVNEYMQNATPPQKAEFERIKSIVKKLVPEAEESISYGIIAFKYKGKYLIYFSVAKDHMSVYPTLGTVKPTKGTKGTFRFTQDKPVPEAVVKEIVTVRLATINKS